MKPINDLISQENPRQSIGRESPQRKESESERLAFEEMMDMLWQELTKIYGHQLQSQFGETIPDTWERLLKGISPNRIEQGLNRVLTRRETWPPNAAEFRQLCLPDTISPDGNNSSAYIDFKDPKHPSYEAPRIESDDAKKRRMTARQKAMREMGF